MKNLILLVLAVTIVACGKKSSSDGVVASPSIPSVQKPLTPEVNSYRVYDEKNIDQTSPRKDVVRIYLSPDANRRILHDEIFHMYFRQDQSFLGLSPGHQIVEAYSQKVTSSLSENDLKNIDLHDLNQIDPNFTRIYFDKQPYSKDLNAPLLRNHIYYLKTVMESEKEIGETESVVFVECLDTTKICHQYKVHFIVKKYQVKEK